MPADSPLDNDDVFDLLRGLAALTGSQIIANLARVVAASPRKDLAIALNHKQIGSKLWLRDSLFETLQGRFRHVLILGGWYGVLPAILLEDSRFGIDRITTLDLNEDCAPIARMLNRQAAEAGRFTAATGDMLAFDYTAAAADLIVNTSCEHLDDVPAWLARVPAGTRVVLQSNDYAREPDHRSTVPSLEAFERQVGLTEILFRGKRPTRNYTRFMLIGSR